MATLESIIRRITIVGKTEGVDKAAGDVRSLAGAQADLAVISERTEASTLSMEKRINSIQRSLDADYRSTQNLAKITKELDAAERQGLITLDRKNELLRLAADRHRDVARSTTLADAATSRLTGSVMRLAAVYLSWRTVTGTMSAIATATIEAERTQTQLEAVVRSTGEAANLSARELHAMAEGFEDVTYFADESVKAAQAVLLTYTRIGENVFPRTLEATLDMSAALGVSLTQAAEMVGKAIDLPSRGMSALADRGFFFTQQQKDVVKSLEETGRLAEAQAIVLGELEAAYGGSARAARDTLGGALQALKVAWDDLFEANGPEAMEMQRSIDGLVETLNDPQTIANVQSFGAALFDAFNKSLPLVMQILGGVEKVFDFAFPEEGGNLRSQWGDQAEEHLKSVLTGRDVAASSLDGGNGWEQFGPMSDFFGPNKAGGRTDRLKPPYKAPDLGLSDDQVKEGERLEKAYAKVIETADKRIAQLGIEAEVMRLAGVEADTFRIQQELMNQAEASGVEMTPTRIEQIRQLAEQITDAELTLEGLQITLENATPWETMATNMQRVQDLLDRGKVSWADYAAEMGTAAETMVGGYVSAADNVLGNVEKMTDAMGLQGREAFEVQKGLSLARAVVSGTESVVHSYNAGTAVGGPPVGLLFAGIAAAATAAQISAIASTSYQSKSMSGSAGGGSTPSAAGAAGASESGPTKSMNVTFHGTESQASSMRDVLEGIMEFVDDKDLKLNFLHK